jgi:3-oxoacyl-[acyl-carrier protein] reductase
MDLQIRGKSALVTGGSRGIGRAIALALAQEGVDVAICARGPEALERTADEIRKAGVRAISIKADMSVAADCQRAVDTTAEGFGRLDILVNNAAGFKSGRFAELTDEDLLSRIYVKALGYIRCSRAAIPHILKVGGGRIICIAGMAARNPGETTLPSGLGNAAVVNFAKHLANELAPKQILVNVIHPPFTRSGPFVERVAAAAKSRGISPEEAERTFAGPIGRVVDPEDIAGLAVFLASRQASAITGQTIAVDGGSSKTIIY